MQNPANEVDLKKVCVTSHVTIVMLTHTNLMMQRNLKYGFQILG